MAIGMRTTLRPLSGCVVAVLVLVGCGGARQAREPATPDGLRPAGGYASYAACAAFSPGCSGAVPRALRRPLHLPRLTVAARGCPVSRSARIAGFVGPASGPGPVYPMLGGSGPVTFVYPPPSTSQLAGSSWGDLKVLWVAEASYGGPVLVRGRQIDGPHAVGFGDGRVPVSEIQLLAPGAFAVGQPDGWRAWPSSARLAAGGCYAFQVDGTTFSSVVVFAARSSRAA
jgi:hypothetical protein